ncbi:MAG: hypothetical protein AAGD22_11785 [Verrucomicrobiota bacterium]
MRAEIEVVVIEDRVCRGALDDLFVLAEVSDAAVIDLDALAAGV